MRAAVAEFFASGAGQAALAVLIVGIVDLGLQLLSAIRRKRHLHRVAERWFRQSLAGSILPIWLLLFVGFLGAEVAFANIPLILAAGLGAAGVYVATVVAAVVARWGH